jgi:prepilin-type N-terminal cleavage/methylation domain-containing protein
MQVAYTSWRARRPAGFTMIELLVVIAVLALLIGLVTFVASRAIHQQKVRNTQQIMQNVTLAIEQFATANPLRQIYDRKDRQTFGQYPPYQLANYSVTTSVAMALEPSSPGGNNRLSDRLFRDLGNSQGAVEDWVRMPNTDDGAADTRALYAYLRVYSPAALRTVPETALKPVDPSARDYVNPKGRGTTVGDDGLVDVLGICDAWGVPLDYMLYVKCEYRLAPGGLRPSWVVTERRPVLRSRGIDREVYDAWVQSAPDDVAARDPRLSPADKWLFSEDLPRPWADVDEVGRFQETEPQGFGWVRAVGLAEDYAYRPDGDTEEP